VTTPAIIHLIGHPGVGKYTIAKALVDAAAASKTRVVLMDNHATANLILPLLDKEGIDPVPKAVWDRVGEVRDVVYRTIEDMSPPDWSFVFTNVLAEEDPGDHAVATRLADLARASGRRYLAVRLHCELDEHLTRVTSPEREARHKWTDVPAVSRFVSSYTVLRASDYDPIDLDTTTNSPEQSAEAILMHLAQGGPIR
jgi:hypothetical protein